MAEILRFGRTEHPTGTSAFSNLPLFEGTDPFSRRRDFIFSNFVKSVDFSIGSVFQQQHQTLSGEGMGGHTGFLSVFLMMTFQFHGQFILQICSHSILEETEIFHSRR